MLRTDRENTNQERVLQVKKMKKNKYFTNLM